MRRRRPASSRSKPRALLIDGLGTLVWLAPPAPALRSELARRFGVDVSEAEAQRALTAEISFYRANMARGRDADSLAQLRRECAEVLMAALPDPERIARSGIDAVTDVLLRSLRFEAFEDARPALVRARRDGARIVVVSNWDVSLVEVLERVGLAPLLDGVVTSAAIGAAKPAPEIFRHGLALAGVGAQDALHVGDNLAQDVEGARACGIEAVLLVRDGEGARSGNGVTTIDSLHRLTWPQGPGGP
jgi:putative hydrolase of the HAD superfamily